MRKTRTTNPELIKLIRTMRKKSRENKARIWRDIADRLSRPRQIRTTVNVSRLNRHTEDGETIAVPGKVLGSGRIDHPITVAAFTFSEQAEAKILGAKGRCLTIQELVERNPNGTSVRLIE